MKPSTLNLLAIDLTRLMTSHDWTFEYSDDPKVHNNGIREWQAITDLVSDMGGSGDEIFKQMLRDHAPPYHPGYNFVHPKKPSPIPLPPVRYWNKLKPYYTIKVGDRIEMEGHDRYVQKGDQIIGLPVRDLHDHEGFVSVRRLSNMPRDRDGIEVPVMHWRTES